MIHIKYILFIIILISSPIIHAANWLKLQGTETTSASARAHVWGFVQAQYQHDFSDPNTNDAYTPIKLIGPNLTSQSMFNVNRARVGVRGTGMPIDSKINYFILGEFGNNGLTKAGDNISLTDASITLNHIPYLRVRMGLFKYPGSEEGLQAIHVSDYINFTTVTNQLMLERFPNRDNYYKTSVNNVMRANTEAQWLGIAPNGFERPVGAFRDVGLQVFDWINIGDWQHSYALMFGNGNGTNFGDNNSNKTFYGYWSSELIFNGKGGRREGVKIYAWYQNGLRAYDQDMSYVKNAKIDPATGTESTTEFSYSSAGAIDLVHYKRIRSGIGIKYLKSPFKVSAEFMQGSGMIFLGPHKESFDMNVPDGNGNGLTGKANGWYLDGGWRIFDTKFEANLRFDSYNRLVGDALEVNFFTVTLGGQYYLNKKSRLTVNYAHRNASSANNNPALENNLKGVGGRFAIQMIAVY